MSFSIIEGDITKIECDAIVNAANCTLLGGSGVDGAIHRAAGPRLFWACVKLCGCKPGHVKMTKAYRLPCKYIFHTVGPKWKDGSHQEPEVLASCFRECLRLAKETTCQSIAFPMIGAGDYGCPRHLVIEIATNEVTQFLKSSNMDVLLIEFNH